MRFLKTTILGGLVFLVPLTVLVAVVAKAHGLLRKLAVPVIDQVPAMAGRPVLADLLALLLILAACFVAGLVSRGPLLKRLAARLDSSLLQAVPGYVFLKGLTGDLAGTGQDALTPVLARFDDHALVAFQVETLPDGRHVLFVPGAPEPWSGSLLVVEADRVERIDQSLPAVIGALKRVGRGYGALLQPVAP